MEQLNNENVLQANNDLESIGEYTNEAYIGNLNQADKYLSIYTDDVYKAMMPVADAVLLSMVPNDPLVRKYCADFTLFDKFCLSKSDRKGNRNRRAIMISDEDRYMIMAKRSQWSHYLDWEYKHFTGKSYSDFCDSDISPQSGFEDLFLSSSSILSDEVSDCDDDYDYYNELEIHEFTFESYFTHSSDAFKYCDQFELFKQYNLGLNSEKGRRNRRSILMRFENPLLNDSEYRNVDRFLKDEITRFDLFNSISPQSGFDDPFCDITLGYKCVSDDSCKYDLCINYDGKCSSLRYIPLSESSFRKRYCQLSNDCDYTIYKRKLNLLCSLHCKGYLEHLDICSKMLEDSFSPQSSFFDPFTIFTDPLGLKKMCDQLPDVVDVINDKLPDTNERKEFLDFFKNIGSKIPSTGFLNSDSKMLQSAFDIVSSIGKLHPTVLISVASAWYAHDRGWLSFAFFIACAVYFVIKVPDQLGFLLNIYLKMGDAIPMVPDIDMDSISPQISDSALEVFGTVLAGALIGVVSGNSRISTSAIVLMFVKDFSRTRLGMIEIAKLVVNFFEKIVNLVRSSFLDMPSIKIIDSCSNEIDEFSREVRNYSFKFNRGILPQNETTYSNIVGLMEVGKQLLRSIPKDKFSEASLRMVHEDCMSLKKISIDLERSDISLRGMKQEPVGIIFSGGPGVAKSIAMLYLSYIVAKDSLTPEERVEFDINPGKFIFSRKQENVFFDTLTNLARVFNYDDFLQARDAAGSPNSEAMEIIRIINSDEFNAHMAHLENKGNTYVRPKYVIVTTNQPDLKSNSIISSTALKRRFQLSYLVVPKECYTRDEDLTNDLWNRRLDHSKLPVATVFSKDDKQINETIVSDLRPEHLDYFEYDLNTHTVGKHRTFQEIVVYARAAELEKRKHFALHKQNFKNLVKKYSAIYDIKAEEIVCPDDYSFDPSISPQSGDDTESEYPFEEFDCTEEQIMRLEIMLTMRPDYVAYLRTCLRSGHKNDIYALSLLMIDHLGYEEAYDSILAQEQFPSRFKFKAYDKPSLPIRVFNSVKDIIDKFLSYIPSWTEFKAKFTFDRESVISILTFIAGSSILTFFAKWIYSWWTGKEVPQSFGFSDKMRSHKVNPKFVKNSQAIKNFIKVQPQFSEDSSGIDLITSLVRKNCFRFELLSDEDKWNCLGSITFVRGRIALIPYHFLVKLMSGVDVDRSRLQRHVRIGHGKEDNDPGLLFTVEEILDGHQYGKLGENDIALIEFPKRMPERQDIVDKFALLRDMDFNQVNLDVMLPVITKNRGFYFGKGRKYGDVIGITKFKDFNYTIEHSYTYDIPTQPGDCGSLFCVLNPSLQKRKIFGVHVAGHDYHGDGFAAFVCQEYLVEDLKLFEDQVVSEVPDLISPQSSDLDLPVRFEILGRTRLVPSRNLNSEIRRSRMYGSLGNVNMAPALLRTIEDSGTIIDPLLNAQRKYCKPDVMFDMEIARKCMAHYFSYCEWQSTYTVLPRIYTLDESIFGLEYDMDFGSVNSSSSVGWPGNVPGQRNLKKELFSYEYGSVEQNIVKDLISVKVNEVITKARNNVRMFHLFSDNLKDELRDLAKVKSGSTRLFSGAPFEYFLAFRMYFGAFGLWFMKNRVLNGSSIGVNPYSSEWNSIAKRLLVHGADNILAGDYEKYDGSQKALIHLLMLFFINLWYDDGADNARIRSILWMEVYNSRHVVDGLIYEWLSGLGSGHPFTIIINTIYGHFNLRYAWYKSIGSLTAFNDNVYAVVQGDDVAAAVSDLYKLKFNDIIISKYMAEVGMVYTNETKDGTLIATRNITEIEFLKRKFVFDSSNNLWIAPLRLQSILKMVDWTKKKHKNAIVCSNVITAIRELSLHERSVHDLYAPRIIKAFQKHYPFLTTCSPLIMDYECRKSEVMCMEAFY